LSDALKLVTIETPIQIAAAVDKERQMPHYLVTFKSPVQMHHMSQSELARFKDGITRLHNKGSMKASYTKVGGGSIVLLLESPDNAHLALELRKHFIVDAEVVPLIPLRAEIDAHIEYRKTKKLAV
jgi:hypothetical protein